MCLKTCLNGKTVQIFIKLFVKAVLTGSALYVQTHFLKYQGQYLNASFKNTVICVPFFQAQWTFISLEIKRFKEKNESMYNVFSFLDG